jgi:hypothetical protein
VKRTRFTQLEKVITPDLNSFHELTEEGLADLIKAISGGLDEVLFNNLPHTYVVNIGVDVTITVPGQHFAVDGVVGSVALTSFIRPDPLVDTTFRIFLVVGRTGVNANRDVLDLGPPLAVISQLLQVEDIPASRIELTSAAPPGVPPALGPTDVGYVELGSVSKIGGVWSMVHNTSAIYAFPGLGPSYAPHAARHIDAMDDPIQIADMTGRIGLMPVGSYPVLMGSLQLMEISPSMPYLVRVLSGDNTPGNPRKATLTLRTSPSFKVDMSGPDPLLALDLATGPYAGDSNRPARWNHRHSPEESPIAVMTYAVTVGPGNLNTLMPEIEFTGMARIYEVQVFWAKPGTVSPQHPAVACGLMETAQGVVGVSGVITGNNKVRLQVGNRAFAWLNGAAVAYMGAVTWTYSVDPSFPTSGEIFVRVTGVR